MSGTKNIVECYRFKSTFVKIRNVILRKLAKKDWIVIVYVLHAGNVVMLQIVFKNLLNLLLRITTE